MIIINVYYADILISSNLISFYAKSIHEMMMLMQSMVIFKYMLFTFRVII